MAAHLFAEYGGLCITIFWAFVVPVLGWVIRRGLATRPDLEAVRTDLAEYRSRLALHKAEDQVAHAHWESELRSVRERMASLPTAADLADLRLILERMRGETVKGIGDLAAEIRAQQEIGRAHGDQMARALRHIEVHGRILAEAAAHDKP